ncbi:GGDEF domain-containing protein [Anaerorhabdus sp.]|uniref:GGDEF domain-containing protein n=1 Tax=Anaerorhabdus sp. TaxID=1872524 RepID=UPI002FC79A0D
MKIKKIRTNLLILLACVILTSFIMPTLAEKSKLSYIERATITVAILKEEGVNIDALSDDYLTGYTHEYLTKLEQFSPVQFEYIYYDPINEQILDILEKVKEGKIDLVGGMLKNNGFDDGYLYSDFSYGYVSTSLLARSDNNDMNERVVLMNEPVKIGLIASSKSQRQLLENYCEENKLTPTIVEFDSYVETECALLNNEIDLMIGRDTAKSADLKVVDNLAESPYYFVTASNKTNVISLINDAMKELNILDPEFTNSLYEKYYSTANLSTALTSEEKTLITNLRAMNVGVIPNNYPLEYYDESSKQFKGILIDLMNLISENTGLKINYVQMDSLDNLTDDFEFGVIDMILGVPNEYSRAINRNYLLTSPIVELPIVRISNSYVSRNNQIAMSGYLNLNSDYIVNYDDQDMFKMVSQGNYKEAYIDGYRAQYLSSYYRNVSIIPSIYENYQLAIGLHNKQDYRIMNILEQGIRGISQHQIDEIIYSNVIDKEKYSLMDYFKQNPAESVGIILVVSVMMVGVLSLFLFKANQMKKELDKEKEKYEMLSQYDQLTKVYNQQTFKTKVQECIDRKSSGSIISMDLDNFKIINDTNGHFEGDRLLSEFGNQLNHTFGQYITGRLGGDEFMVYMDSVQDSDELQNICQKFLDNMHTIENNYSLTISIGIVVFHQIKDFDELYYQVDRILYDVKASGRNNIKIEKI